MTYGTGALVPVEQPGLSNIELKALPAPHEMVTETAVAIPEVLEGDETMEGVKDNGDGYVELMDEFSLHRFIIRKGKTLEEAEEFISYKRNFAKDWASISYLIHLLEKMLTEDGVPHAVIDGKKLGELSEKTRKPSREQLFDCFANPDDVGEYIKIPTRMFKGSQGVDKATMSIQKNWRRYKAQTAYSQLKFLM